MPLSASFVALFFFLFQINISSLKKHIFHANGKACYSENNTEFRAINCLSLSLNLLVYKMNICSTYLRGYEKQNAKMDMKYLKNIKFYVYFTIKQIKIFD